jgi:hypothetical protein
MDEKAPEFIRSILTIDSLGYDCDYISEKYLLSTSFINGKLETAAGTRYAALILPPDCILTAKVKKHIANAYRLVFNDSVSVFDAVLQIKSQVPDSPEIRHIIEFINATKLGIIARK